MSLGYSDYNSYNSLKIFIGLNQKSQVFDIPLKDRDGNSFPQQVVNYSERRDHCLITGLQLLGLYLDCKGNSQKKAEMIDRIFSTNGVFRDYQDWRGFLIDINDK